MIVGRRSFFGLLAAPAIISITGRLQPALLVPPAPDFTTAALQLRATERYAYGWMDYQRFREIVEPILREHFEEVFKNEPLFGGRHEPREVRRQLRRLPAQDRVAQWRGARR